MRNSEEILNLVIVNLDGKHEIIEVKDFYELPPKNQIEVISHQSFEPPKHIPKAKKYYQCSHNGIQYASVIEAHRRTGVPRYWINKYCDKSAEGWKWVKKLGGD